MARLSRQRQFEDKAVRDYTEEAEDSTHELVGELVQTDLTPDVVHSVARRGKS